MQGSLSSLRVIIATHELFYGASHALRDYLNGKKVDRILFISHPVRPENHRSYRQKFFKGKLQGQREIRRGSGRPWWYAVDVLLTVAWALGERGMYDVYIGVDPLNCLAGLVLKLFGLSRHVIFYSIDFVPRRFGNRLLDGLYHWVERVCVRFADERWDVSPRIALGRERFLGLCAKAYPARIVPIGVWQRDILVHRSYEPHRFAFVGHLLPKQGVHVVLEALPLVLKRVPGATFLIIGGGEQEARLRRRAHELGIADRVRFTGWLGNQQKIRELLADCAFGVATYDPKGTDADNFTYYADPTKIKTYLACGLPVVLTDVAHNAEDLERAGCVLVVSYTKEAIAEALLRWLSDRQALEAARKKAIAVAKTFTWERIFRDVSL